ncbi:MAG: Ig-like domain-containing protein [Phycisphaeraceae bacterium]|nr:Ig-like domain-containing protein [Phycisphaeraceae bacterium]
MLRAIEPVDCSVPDEACGKAALMKYLFRAGRAPAAPFQDRDAHHDTDVVHNSLTIEVFPSTQSVEGVSVITLQSRVDGLTEFTFSLAPALTPGQILVNGVAVLSPVSAGAQTRTVTLDRPYNTGETVTITIPFSGPALQGQSGILWSTQDGQPVVSSFSEPFDAGTWWACKDGDRGLPGDNSDKATWDLTITHDAGLTAISNGRLVSQTPIAGGKTVTRWESDYPMATYLGCFSLAKYNNWSLTYQGAALPTTGPVAFPLRFFIYSAFDTPARRAAWELVVPMLDAMRPLYGEYPFVNEGYGIYQFPFGGGMEHQTMSGQGNYAEQVTIHELGHQWWGDNVTCRTWSDIWLNEGFATYTEALWAEHKPGSTGATALQNYMIGTKPAAENVGGSVYCFDTSDEARIFSRDLTYRKAAWVLHMLRGIVGDQKFFGILATWRSEFQGSAATTDDFRSVCEQVYGQSLGWFFNQWVFGIGAPTYAKGLQTFSVNGKYWTRFHVRQTQDSAWPVFTNPLLVRLSTGAGPVDHIVKPIARTSFFVRSSGVSPASDLFFDPNSWVLNYGVAGEAPLQGPPVILESAPMPGASFEFGASPLQITLEFSENVATDGSQFVVRRGPGSPVPFTFSYSAALQTATLAFESALSPSTYTIELVGTPTAIATGQELDGDVFDPESPKSLPTGDGQAGTTIEGVKILRFFVIPGACPCDLNGDSMVDDSDFVVFAAAYNALLTMAADFNGDGLTDDADFVIFAHAYDQLLCL